MRSLLTADCCNVIYAMVFIKFVKFDGFKIRWLETGSATVHILKCSKQLSKNKQITTDYSIFLMQTDFSEKKSTLIVELFYIFIKTKSIFPDCRSRDKFVY